MNENLKKILSASIDGYIYHTDEAERIVSDLTKLTSAELDPTKDSYILQNIDAYLEFLEQKDMDKEAVKVNELKYIIARKNAKIKALEMENELMRDFLSLTERK